MDPIKTAEKRLLCVKALTGTNKAKVREVREAQNTLKRLLVPKPTRRN